MFSSLINPKIYTTSLDQDRARLIYVGTVFLMIFFTAYALLVKEDRTGGMTTFQSAANDPTALLALISTYIIGVITLIATWKGWRTISGFGPGAMWFMSGALIAFQEGFIQPSNGITLVILILLTGLLNREPGIIVGYIISLVMLLIGYGRTATANPQFQTSELVTVLMQVTGISVLVYLFLRSTQLTRSEALAQSSEDRLKLANINTQIAERISRRQQLGDVLNTTVEQIRDSYPDIYHVQIFLIDDTRTLARLTASTGDVGRLLLRRQHSLAVGSQSVIGNVTMNGELVIARAGESNTVHRRNEFLPDTVAEAAFPLRIGENIIGVLDLQSKIPEAFPDVELPIFQSLADNIAIAIDNTRLVEQTAQRLVENQRLVEQMRDAVQQVELLNQQLTSKAWSDYVTGRENEMALLVDVDQNIVQRGAEWTPALTEAAQQNALIQQQNGEQSVVAIPLQVRGQAIGAMEFELDAGSLTPEAIDLIQTVAERFGLAVESARLYDESRRVARREAMLNEIGSRLQSSNKVDSVLSEAARSLQTTLGAQRVAIRLGTPRGGNGGRNGNS